MADIKKYYYLKLKDNFYDSDAMIILESMENGYLYSNILMKMYLRSLKTNGRLMLNDRIPYNSQMLSKVVGHNKDVVEKAIQIFKELDLIEILDNGAIYMLDIQNYIGKSSDDADRKRLYRDKIKEEKLSIGQMSDKCPDNSPLEIDIEINKEIDNNKLLSTKKVFLKPTLEEVKQYCLERNNNISPQKFIDYYESVGWKVGKNPMKDWKACVRTWEGNQKQQAQPKYVEATPSWLNMEIPEEDLLSDEEIERLKGGIEWKK